MRTKMLFTIDAGSDDGRALSAGSAPQPEQIAPQSEM